MPPPSSQVLVLYLIMGNCGYALFGGGVRYRAGRDRCTFYSVMRVSCTLYPTLRSCDWHDRPRDLMAQHAIELAPHHGSGNVMVSFPLSDCPRPPGAVKRP